MRRRHSVIGFVGGLFLLVGLSAWSQAASGIDAVVIFATNSIRMDMNTTVVSGDIVVNNFSNGPTLQSGFELSIKKNSTIVGAIRADSIKLFKEVTVEGTVECNDGTGVDCSAGLTLPVFRPEELPEVRTPVLGPDAEDVVVGMGETVFLDAGDYLDITIDNGGTLIFTGGIYNIGSILPASTKGGGCAYSPCRSLEFLAPSELRILGMFDIGSDAYVGPRTGSTAVASSIILYVTGTNLVPEDPLSDPPVARVGKDSTVEANFWAPNGTLVLKKSVIATGAFWGRDVDIDKDGQIQLASSFNPPPTADAQNVVTNGTAAVDITLTGSDPEDEPLKFSIVSGPSHGSLTDLSLDPQNPPSSATVTYTAWQTGDLQDEFTFRVIDPNGGFDEAVVWINTVDTSESLGEVLAADDSLEILKDRAVTITLTATAPCEDGPQGDLSDPCDGIGNDVPLTFSVVDGTGPTHGSLSDPTQGTEVPQRSATVTYTPESGFEGEDSFEFQACGDVNGDESTTDPGECDTATVIITVDVFTPPALT